MMDWCAIDSDADFVLLCCGEEKTECESEALNFVICFSLSTQFFFSKNQMKRWILIYFSSPFCYY